jgi:hypothetical protein
VSVKLTLFSSGKLQLQLGVVGDEGHERGSQAKCPALDVDGGSLLMHACPLIQLSCILHNHSESSKVNLCRKQLPCAAHNSMILPSRQAVRMNTKDLDCQ